MENLVIHKQVKCYQKFYWAHDVLFMETVKQLLSAVKTDEYGYIENNLL